MAYAAWFFEPAKRENRLGVGRRRKPIVCPTRPPPEGARETADESALAGLAANAVENDGLPTDLADRYNRHAVAWSPFARRF